MTTMYLLASDMDGTVIPPEKRRQRGREIDTFRRLVRARRDVTLAYVTGRHFALALDGVRSNRLPRPAFFLCDVGTSLYAARGKGWEIDETYRKRMRRKLGGCSGDDIAEALDEMDDISPQEPEKQAEFKRSYYIPLQAERKKIVERVKSRLSRRGILANLVYSVDTERRRGLLDILPADVAKHYAVRFLAGKLGVSRARVVYAGDSGNDMLAFTVGWKTIVVANAPDNVKDVLKSLIRKRPGKFKRRIYFAEESYVKGVIEGARRFGVLG